MSLCNVLGEPLSDFGYLPVDEYMQVNRKNVGMLLFKPNVQVCKILISVKFFSSTRDFFKTSPLLICDENLGNFCSMITKCSHKSLGCMLWSDPFHFLTVHQESRCSLSPLSFWTVGSTNRSSLGEKPTFEASNQTWSRIQK